jgi:hypothetical protein
MLWNELGLGLGVAIIRNGAAAMSLLDIIMFSYMNSAPKRTRLVISKDRNPIEFLPGQQRGKGHQSIFMHSYLMNVFGLKFDNHIDYYQYPISGLGSKRFRGS